MMTATLMPSPDLETIMLPDDAEIIPCENEQHVEPIVARWALCCSGCGAPNLMCTSCKETFDAAQADGARLYCTRCNTTIPSPIPWVRI